jgi:hypothetical protein
MIVRNGKVAMKFFQAIPQRVKIGSTEYFFEPKKNISMAWVLEEHANTVLGIVRVCCGGNRNNPYRYASEADVRMWMGEAER